MTCAVSVVISWVSLFSISVPGANFFDLIFVRTSGQSLKGQLGLLEKSGAFKQLLSNRAVADNPRLLASAGLSPVVTWFHLWTASVPEYQSHGLLRRQAVFQASATIVVRSYCQSTWNIFRTLVIMHVALPVSIGMLAEQLVTLTSELLHISWAQPLLCRE